MKLFGNFPVYVLSVAPAAASTWPIRDTETGDTTVQWDHYSLIYKGERLVSFGGEFHPFRIPVPEMWVDVMEKIKAMGMNTMSFYNHWGFHAPSVDTLDFETGAHDLERLYKMATDIGLFVHARPGPYINGELNAGGEPLWLTTGEYGKLRENGTAYMSAWKPYMDKVAEITVPYQVTHNGTVILYQIENEFPEQWSDVENKVPRAAPIAYMEQLYGNARENGLNVPLTHNMPGQKYKAWSVDYDTVGAGGNVDIYGLDNYPACWSCIPSDCSTSNPSFTLADYTAHFNEVSPKQPSMMPEFQGGATNPWYGPAGGCEAKTDESFVNFYYRDNIAQRVTILGLYMIYGGTNWGWLGAPFLPSSYGYSAAISENRTIGSKYHEIKSLALFTRVAKFLAKMDMVGNSTSYTDNDAITTIELRNPDTGAGLYALRHTDPVSDSQESLRLSVSTSAGDFTIPAQGGVLALNGHVSKLLVTDFKFGGSNLIYSTAEVLTYGIFDRIPTLALWVPNGEGGEFLIQRAKSARVASGNRSKVKIFKSRRGLIVNFQEQQGITVLTLDTGARVLLMDRDTAHLFWVPALTNDPTVPVDQVAFVQGPHLVRSAELHDGLISIKGDSKETAQIEVFTTRGTHQIKWNGKLLDTRKTNYGSLKARIDGPVKFSAPRISTWKVHDSLPERFPSYSDASPAWAEANHMTTVNPSTDATKPYLYVDEYGFHTGVHLWRGYFNGSADGVYLNVQGGIAHGWSAWLNGEFIGSFLGDLDSSTGSDTLEFPSGAVKAGNNVLLVMQDNSGHDQGSASLNVRGILNATLINSASRGFSSWKIAGTAGGTSGKQIDPVRTIYNEGGLTAERLGWHLPGFDDRDWPEGSPSDGFEGAGVRFYRSSLPLHMPEGHDVSLSVKLALGDGIANSFRAYIYVNGYQYAKYFPHVNSQMDTFPVPPGIWNYSGDNTIGVAVWNQGSGEVKCDVEVVVDYVLASSLDVRFDGQYLRPAWKEDRLISQLLSRAPLTASIDGIRKLVTHFTVFPDLRSILHQFGSRTGNQSESYGSFHSSSRLNSTERAYLFKFVEEHGRTLEQNPWSIRQVGLYERSDQKNNNFVLNPPKSLRSRLKATLATPEIELSATNFRLLVLSIVSKNWSKYVDWLDETFHHLKLNAHSASTTVPCPSTTTIQYTPDITISDAQNIEVHRIGICEAQSCLKSNRYILEEIGIGGAQSQGAQHLSQHLRSNRTQPQRLGTILEMLDSTSTLIRNILDIRSLEALEANSRTTTEISQEAKAGNDLMLNLSRESYRDARTLKVITIVTLVYLPASFIAQFLSMGYLSISTNEQNRNVEFHFRGELVVFAVLTVIFLAITIGIWLWMDKPRARGR